MDRPFFIVNDNPAKLQHLCRMCAAPCNKAVPIFGPEGEENELAIKFNKYLPVKVFETDSIPLQLCYECTNLLMQWDAAILVAVAADKKLRALLWREQQSQEVNMKEKEETQQSVQIRKRKRSSARAQEALCCSVCNKKGMDFRELVEHLKTHKDPGAETETCSIQATGIGDANCSINDLLTPVVCLETLDLERQLRSKKSNSESQQEKTDSSNKFKKKGKRGKLKRVTRSTEQNSDVNDLLVTSSTSTPYNKPPETSEGDNTHSAPVNTANNFANPSSDAAATTGCNTKKELTPDNQNNTFKPKVRIISAESINQTLEERAKANQTAKSLESYQPDVLITGSSPLSGGPSPPKSPTKPPMRRLVLSGQVVNGINPDTAKPGQKFLKLSDGRIIKIIQNNPNSPVTLAPTGQRVQVLSRKVIGSNNEKPAFQLRPLSPDALKIAGSQAQKSDEAQPTLVRQMRRVGNKEFYFICQPGPRHCPNRYICAFCCKRNLTQESLQEHSELHVFPSDKSPLNQC